MGRARRRPNSREIGRDMAQRVLLQRQLTNEVERTIDAYRRLEREQPPSEPFDLPARFRNPHDHASDFDALDRKDPVILGVPHFLLMIPGLKHRTRAVPARAVAEYGEDEDGQMAMIDCPCGAKPIARAGFEKCPGCERYYSILGGKRALVLYGAMPLPWADGEDEPPPASSCAVGQCDGSGFVPDEKTNTAHDCACRPQLIAARRS